jgi:glycine hydroxymethyltransferase
MPQIVELIDTVLSNVENEQILKSVKEKVNSLMKNMPLFAW